MIEKGHGQEALQRYARMPVRNVADGELLEMLLYYVFPDMDVKFLVEELLAQFGSLAAIFSAEPFELQKIDNANEFLLIFIKLIYDLFSRFHIPVEGDFFVINNWNAVLNYCKMSMSYKKYEVFRIFYINHQNILIAEEEMQQGTLSEVVVYPRQIVKQCIERGAASVIIAHNHPGGNCKPSREDIEMTMKIKLALNSISTKILDHIIITRSDFFSFKKHGLL